MTFVRVKPALREYILQNDPTCGKLLESKHKSDRLRQQNSTRTFHFLYCFVKRFDLTWVKVLLTRQECVVGGSAGRLVVAVYIGVRTCVACSIVCNVQVMPPSKRRAIEVCTV